LVPSGGFWLKSCADGLERGLKARQKARANLIIEICHPDLKQGLLSAIRQIQLNLTIGWIVIRLQYPRFLG